jgi:hypothetical protein
MNMGYPEVTYTAVFTVQEKPGWSMKPVALIFVFSATLLPFASLPLMTMYETGLLVF